jgi:hypothetical protein
MALFSKVFSTRTLVLTPPLRQMRGGSPRACRELCGSGYDAELDAVRLLESQKAKELDAVRLLKHEKAKDRMIELIWGLGLSGFDLDDLFRGIDNFGPTKRPVIALFTTTGFRALRKVSWEGFGPEG